ncbi:MAG: FapA family protein [Clostridiales bacterium]|jgi:uncharacterized protein (DUF342 family)|nr:FapA family protein [Clostridiales bacterium]
MDGMQNIQTSVINEQAAVSISKDLLFAYITFSPPNNAGQLLAYNDIIKIITNARVSFGVDDDVVLSLAGNPNKRYGTPVCIAKGTPPENGKDAKIDFYFSIARDRTPRIMPNGDVDHKALNLIENVHKGDLLARMTKETPGVPGKSILGTEIKPKGGKQRIMPKGKNTEVLPGGVDLVASADGKVEIQDGRIIVNSELEIKGDVGVATGHIVFAGDVKITGNIISTYNVMAEGSIYIGGCIEASQITAGKDITISQGIKGLSARGISDCSIYAGGNITSKFIENATVFANGTIRTDSILNSSVSCYDTVLVWGRSGSIIGGKVRAAKEIVCDVVGSPGTVSAARTILESGLTESLMENFVTLKEEVERLTADIAKFKSTISEIENFPSPTTAQNKRLYASKQNLKDAEITVTGKMAELDMLETTFQRSGLGKITINRSMYPTVVMTIGKQAETFEDAKKSVYFRAGDDGIKVMNI